MTGTAHTEMVTSSISCNLQFAKRVVLVVPTANLRQRANQHQQRWLLRLYSLLYGAISSHGDTRKPQVIKNTD